MSLGLRDPTGVLGLGIPKQIEGETTMGFGQWKMTYVRAALFPSDLICEAEKNGQNWDLLAAGKYMTGKKQGQLLWTKFIC